MANNFQKAQRIVNTMAGVLDREVVLQKLVWSDAVTDWAGVQGETVNLRVPGRMKARTRTLRTGTPLTLDSLSETLVPLKLTTDIYSGVPLLDEELTLDILDFEGQVATPQMLAVAQQLENEIGTLMADAPYVTTITVDPDAPHLAVTAARRALNDAFVPMGMRAGVLGSGLEEAFLNSDQLTRFDMAGDSTAFRDALIGRVRGIDFSSAQSIDPGLGIIFHKTAFAIGLRSPVVPAGASFGASRAYNGLALRWIRDYDPLYTTDRSLFSTYYGGNYVTDLVDPTNAESGEQFVRAVRLEMPVSSVNVTPATKTLTATNTWQLSVVVTYADGTTRDVTDDIGVVYVSGTPSKATVNATGLITAVASGGSTVTATYGGQSDTCVVTVS